MREKHNVHKTLEAGIHIIISHNISAGSRRSRSGRLHSVFIIVLQASVPILHMCEGGKRTRKGKMIKKYEGRKWKYKSRERRFNI